MKTEVTDFLLETWLKIHHPKSEFHGIHQQKDDSWTVWTRVDHMRGFMVGYIDHTFMAELPYPDEGDYFNALGKIYGFPVGFYGWTIKQHLQVHHSEPDQLAQAYFDAYGANNVVLDSRRIDSHSACAGLYNKYRDE